MFNHIETDHFTLHIVPFIHVSHATNVPLLHLIRNADVQPDDLCLQDKLSLQVDKTCRYDNLTTVLNFESTFRLAGGVNLPKIIHCIGSDGVARKQLVKVRRMCRDAAEKTARCWSDAFLRNPQDDEHVLHWCRFARVPKEKYSTRTCTRTFCSLISGTELLVCSF